MINTRAGASLSAMCRVIHGADSLSKQPDLGRICHFRSRKLANLRCFRMEGAFGKHLIFYRLLDGTPYVFRVLHGMRDLPRRLLDPPGADEGGSAGSEADHADAVVQQRPSCVGG